MTALVDANGKVYIFGNNEEEQLSSFEYNYDSYGQQIVPAKNTYYAEPQVV